MLQGGQEQEQGLFLAVLDNRAAAIPLDETTGQRGSPEVSTEQGMEVRFFPAHRVQTPLEVSTLHLCCRKLFSALETASCASLCSAGSGTAGWSSQLKPAPLIGLRSVQSTGTDACASDVKNLRTS